MSYLYFDPNIHTAEDYIDNKHLFKWKHFSCKCKKHIKYTGSGKNKTVTMFGRAAVINTSLLNGLNELTLLLRRSFDISDMKVTIKTAYRCNHSIKRDPINYQRGLIMSSFNRGMATEILVKGIDTLKLYNMALMIPQFSNNCIGINNRRNVVYIDVDFELPERRRFFI